MLKEKFVREREPTQSIPSFKVLLGVVLAPTDNPYLY